MIRVTKNDQDRIDIATAQKALCAEAGLNTELTHGLALERKAWQALADMLAATHHKRIDHSEMGLTHEQLKERDKAPAA